MRDAVLVQSYNPHAIIMVDASPDAGADSIIEATNSNTAPGTIEVNTISNNTIFPRFAGKLVPAVLGSSRSSTGFFVAPAVGWEMRALMQFERGFALEEDLSLVWVSEFGLLPEQWMHWFESFVEINTSSDTGPGTTVEPSVRFIGSGIVGSSRA